MDGVEVIINETSQFFMENGKLSAFQHGQR